MASQRFEKGTEEYELFKDFYNYIQKYWFPEGQHNDAWWEEVLNEGNKLCEKHKTRWARMLVSTFMKRLDILARGEDC